MVYQQLRRWMEQHLGMTFGPQEPVEATPADRPVEPGEAEATPDVV
jgi:hypothetical protein